MRTFGIVLLSLLVAGPRAVAAGGPSDVSPWRAAVAAELETLLLGLGSPKVSERVMTAAIDAAEREIGALDPVEAAPIVLEAATRAQLRWHLGTPLPRLRAELRQEFRVAMRSVAEAGERLRALERVRRRLEREAPGPGGASAPGRTGGPPRGGWSP